MAKTKRKKKSKIKGFPRLAFQHIVLFSFIAMLMWIVIIEKFEIEKMSDSCLDTESTINSIELTYNKQLALMSLLDVDHAAVEQYIDNCQRLQMYKPFDWREEETVNGVYFWNNYYCVWTKDRPMDQIKYTDCHEYMHALIIENRTCGNETCYEHFCNYE